MKYDEKMLIQCFCTTLSTRLENSHSLWKIAGKDDGALDHLPFVAVFPVEIEGMFGQP